MDSEEENLLGIGRTGGLGLFTAVIFLSGEMAGSGVLSLPKALVGTGIFPFFQIKIASDIRSDTFGNKYSFTQVSKQIPYT